MFCSVVNGSAKTGEGSERGELTGTSLHAHVRKVRRHMMRQIDNIFVVINTFHFSFFTSFLRLVSSYLPVAVAGGGTLFEVHAPQDGILVVFSFDREHGLLHAALFVEG